MRDTDKTKEQLIQELDTLRGRVAELEKLEIEQQRSDDFLIPENYQDRLTGLPNYTLFKKHLLLIIAQAHLNVHKFGLMSLSLDNFEDVIRSFGQTTGNNLLRSVGYRLNSLLRKRDIITRTEDNEFLILLPDTSWMTMSMKIAQRIMKSFQTPFVLNNREIRLRIAMGTAIYPDDANNADDLIKHARIPLHPSQKEDIQLRAEHS
jgi:diguanylate cyclase (GGDEF)-like protein